MSFNLSDRSCIFGGKSCQFYPVKKGGAQGCTLPPAWFFIRINGLLCEIEICPQLRFTFVKVHCPFFHFQIVL